MNAARLRHCGVVLLAAALAGPCGAAEGTRFDSGPELGARLLKNVVRIRALDIEEHGFGVVVGAQARHVFIVTARHVIEPPAGSGRLVADAADRRIEVAFCAGDASAAPARVAEVVADFDAGGHDIVLLRVLRPADYEPVVRAIASDATAALRQEAWLLGQDGQCGVAPGSGAIAALRDERENLLIEFPGVRGGASGGPAISGYGVLGVVTRSDDVNFVVHSITSLQARLRAQSPGRWQLEEARNVPLTDPRSAQIDLSETLNQYLFGVRNLQQLLLQPVVPKQRFVAFADDYGAAINRFRDARDRHDGALARHWPAGVLPQWQALRERLWQVHQPFWELNAADSQAIFDQQRAPLAVQARMRALEPELVQLQSAIAAFLKDLGQRSTP